MYEDILQEFHDIQNLNYALSLLHWDQSTYIPGNGIESRAETIETLTKIFHKKIISEAYLEKIDNFIESPGFKEIDKIQQEEILRIKDDVIRSRKIPVKLATEIAKTSSLAMNLWDNAKRNNDDKDYLPVLQKLIDQKKELASLLGYKENPYDALLDIYDRELNFDTVEKLFKKLENKLIELIRKVNNSTVMIDDSFLFKSYNIKKQEKFGLIIAGKIGLNPGFFRQDISAHPFTTRIGFNDVRITTNLHENNLINGFYSTVHESGHALYELGAMRMLGKSRFADIDSLSLHESQSRLYENIIARSRLFWETYYRDLKEEFEENLENIEMEMFYMAINKSILSQIRIESDELTYNLHIILRADIENSIINGKLNAHDINDAWNEKTKEIFGFYPENKSSGYLQDIHWSHGSFGYFPTYTIGNLISAQIYNTMKNELSLDKINDDTLNEIQNWLFDNFYIHGSRESSMKTVLEVTGEDLNIDYFIQYLEKKFGEIYNF